MEGTQGTGARDVPAGGFLRGWGPTSALGGRFTGPPEALHARALPAARDLMTQAFENLGAAPATDYHVHVLGLGVGGTGAFVNPAMLSWRRPARRFEAGVYLHACGVAGFADFDADYAGRLTRLARAFGRPLRAHLVALDRFHDPDGRVNLARTEFYAPNDYVARLAEAHPDLFVPVISIHPSRPDALEELARWAARGVRFLKWLPNAQGIDPADPRHDAFYRALCAHEIALLTHAGEEHAVRTHAAQALGNPLRLRRPLDHGVRVIIAHCASLGRNADFDRPGTTAENFDLFLRLMAEERYRGRLFGEISAITQFNRASAALFDALSRPEMCGRLVNGSDYPLPAVNCVIWTGRLARMGCITPGERRALNEIYSCNPLLFDFVLKRALRHPTTQERLFPKEVFLENPALRPEAC